MRFCTVILANLPIYIRYIHFTLTPPLSEKLSAEEFNRVRGVKKLDRKDESLYSKAKASKLKKATGRGGKAEGKGEKKTSARKSKASTGSGKAGEGKNYRFFKVTCKDNGIGMPHKEIPNMLGIVLSSTKYGVKQTRGKFGLGAKMALVWSKKSTGLPIEVWSARQDRSLSFCKLDIDINKNQPHVITHESTSNINNWRGTEITVTIGGNWTSYSSKVVRYMRELAIITPYAHFTFKYVDQDDSNKSFSIEFKVIYTSMSMRMHVYMCLCISMHYLFRPVSCTCLLMSIDVVC